MNVKQNNSDIKGKFYFQAAFKLTYILMVYI